MWMALPSHKCDWANITMAGFSQTIHVELKMLTWYVFEMWRESSSRAIALLISLAEEIHTLPWWTPSGRQWNRSSQMMFLCRSADQNIFGMVCNYVNGLNHIIGLIFLLRTLPPASTVSFKEVILLMMFEVSPNRSGIHQIAMMFMATSWGDESFDSQECSSNHYARATIPLTSSAHDCRLHATLSINDGLWQLSWSYFARCLQ